MYTYSYTAALLHVRSPRRTVQQRMKASIITDAIRQNIAIRNLKFFIGSSQSIQEMSI
jgi:hypothetical protein